MSNPMTIALHGASGVQGAPVAERLLRDGHRVRAAVRRPGHAPAGCEPAPADLCDLDSLARAYDGADAVVVQLPGVFDDTAIRQAETVAEALRRAEPRYVVFNPGGPPGAVGLPYLEARTILAQALAAGPSVAAVVYPLGPYMENLSAPWSTPGVRAGVVEYPLPAEAPIPWVAVEDVADRIVAALASREQGTLAVCGPAMPTGEQVAAAIASAVGHPVHWRTLAPAEFANRMRPVAGDAFADGVAGLYAAMLTAGPAPAPERLHTGSMDLATWARSQAWEEALAA